MWIAALILSGWAAAEPPSAPPAEPPAVADVDDGALEVGDAFPAAPVDDEPEAAQAEPEEPPASPSAAEGVAPGVEGSPDDEAEAARGACMALAAGEGMTTCLERVVREYPATTAADRARGALELLQRPAEPALETEPVAPAEPAPAAGAEATPATELPSSGAEPTPPPSATAPVAETNEMTAGLPAFLKPGRLEMGFVGGVLGVWAGGAAGILLGTNADQMNLRLEPWVWVLSTGALAVTSGMGGAAAGYGLAHALELDQGAVWSFTAGATWGASYVISVLPALYELSTPPWYLTDDIIGVTPLLGAGVGAATGLTLALALDPDISEISMMNTGGWIGGLAGALFGFNLSLWTDAVNPWPVTTTAFSFSLMKTGGLVTGLLAAQLLELTWGETLVGDFGAALGGLAFTSVALAVLLSPVGDPALALMGFKGEARDKATVTFVSTMGVAGLAAGVAATTAGLWTWHRLTGRPMWSLSAGAVDVSLTPPFAIVRPGDGPTVLLPGLAGRF